ncbi:SWIM zinc finger family protein [Bifidobacterium leontopitheci]|uniref:SWIM zinc finger protein n=1 Tax=Bifidobacterium leontopitheci TaxID=2650774 RepID=A0A6I1GG77_9BIFI|nr:SWIM zinc finger family protein [Bifidobacterium leontopitheci]KAB7790654.1 SWIM zinc finger protein [Bifidobacterium leontopitheci]
MSLPPKPLLDECETMFDDVPQILERAWNYWDDGRVGDLEQVTASLYHAQVRGSGDAVYDVDVRLDDSHHVLSTACTCPYQATPYCKHVGAVLLALRDQLGGSADGRRVDGSRRTRREDDDPPVSVPKYVSDAILDRIREQELEGDGDVLFFWSHGLRDHARHMRRGKPVSTLVGRDEAIDIMLGPIRAYELAHDISAHSSDEGVDWTDAFFNDGGDAGRAGGNDGVGKAGRRTAGDPGNVENALAGVRFVADNALCSDDYVAACRNLAMCVEALALFLNAFSGLDEPADGYDDDFGGGDGYDPLDDFGMVSDENDLLVGKIRCYMELVAQHADSQTAGKALSMIGKAAYSPVVRFFDPTNCSMLIASALAFADSPDKSMWAYDMIETAMERFAEDHDRDLPHQSLFVSREVLRRYTRMVAYDLYRRAGDAAGCERLWRDHADSPALLLMHAVTLMQRRRFREAYDLVDDHLQRSVHADDADQEIVTNGLLYGLLPHGWHSVLEVCAEQMDSVSRLAGVYRHIIVHASDRADKPYVTRLRRLLKIAGVDADQWRDQAVSLAHRCAGDIAKRINGRRGVDLTEDAGRGAWRNPAYESLIVSAQLTDDALAYCMMLSYPPLDLLRTMAIGHPDRAEQVIFDAMPAGALDGGTVGGAGGGAAGGRRHGTHGGRTLAASRSTYRQVAKQLRRYGTIFGEERMIEVARGIVSRYPNRKALRDELAFAL